MTKCINKKSRKYIKLMEIRSRNSFRKFGMEPKKSITITTIYGEKSYSYKNWIIIQGKI